MVVSIHMNVHYSVYSGFTVCDNNCVHPGVHRTRSKKINNSFSKAVAVSSVSMLSVILSSNPVAWTSLLSSPGRMTIAAAQPAPTSLPVIAPSVKHVTDLNSFH